MWNIIAPLFRFVNGNYEEIGMIYKVFTMCPLNYYAFYAILTVVAETDSIEVI